MLIVHPFSMKCKYQEQKNLKEKAYFSSAFGENAINNILLRAP